MTSDNRSRAGALAVYKATITKWSSKDPALSEQHFIFVEVVGNDWHTRRERTGMPVELAMVNGKAWWVVPDTIGMEAPAVIRTTAEPMSMHLHRNLNTVNEHSQYMEHLYRALFLSGFVTSRDLERFRSERRKVELQKARAESLGRASAVVTQALTSGVMTPEYLQDLIKSHRL